MALKIPLIDHPNFSQGVALDGKVYRITVQWNERGEYWSMGFYTSAGVPIVTSRKLLLGQELTHNLPGLGLPPGSLMAVDLTGRSEQIGRSDLGTGRVALVYTPVAEL